MVKMVAKRRLGAINSETRALLIEAAAQILREQGAAAVTARQLAEQVGLQRHIVHYYFGTIDDLFVAVLQRDSARAREWLAQALVNKDPLEVIWGLGSRAAAVTVEFTVLAAKSEAIRAQYKSVNVEFRKDMAKALERYLKVKGVASKLPAATITIALQAIAYTISIEKLLGITEGHEATKRHMADLFSALTISSK